MKKRTLSKSDIKKINYELEKLGLNDYISKKADVSLIDDKFIQIGDNIEFFYLDDEVIPSLKILQENNFLKKVTVDMKAVQFMIKGADVMRPGITEIEDFENGAIISIVDEKNKKAIALGKALFSSDEMKSMKEGRVIKNIHYVGDDVWNH